MRPTRTPLSITIVVTAAAALAACGSTTESSGGAATTASPTDTTAPDTTATETTATESTATETTATETTVPEATTAPETTAAPATTAAPETTAVPETTAAPATTAAPTTAAPPAGPTVCPGSDAPAGDPATSSITVDLLGDGTPNDVVEGYVTSAGSPRMRVLTGEGVYSEVVGAIDDSFRPLGTAPIFAGAANELLAVTGEGEFGTTVGLFTVDEGDCLVQFGWDSGPNGVFEATIRPSTPTRSGMFCYEGGIDLYGAEQFEDGTWDLFGAGYELASQTSMQYSPASDAYVEGIPESELGTYDLDCLGIRLP
ncbi:MAG: hypothetical protein AAGG08_01990 [Actinomycetota bacterium]